MSMFGEMLQEVAEKREKEVVAWATACGTVDGMASAIDFLREEAGKLFSRGKDEDAKLVRELSARLDSRRKAVLSSIPTTPDPSPAMDG